MVKCDELHACKINNSITDFTYAHVVTALRVRRGALCWPCHTGRRADSTRDTGNANARVCVCCRSADVDIEMFGKWDVWMYEPDAHNGVNQAKVCKFIGKSCAVFVV